VSIREFFLESFAGDLEYNPRRAWLYLGLSVMALCVWIFSPHEKRATTIPLVFLLGSLALCVKGIFLFRKSSEGIGLSHRGLTQSVEPSAHKTRPPAAVLVAQIVQDFGSGAFLLSPVLGASAANLPAVSVFFSGAAVFLVGWMIRRITSPPEE